MKLIIKKIHLIFIGILIIGLILRILNPTFGTPVLYVSGDEAPNYIGALLMMEKQNPFIDIAIYPPLGSYVQIPFLSLAFLAMFVLGKVHTLSELKLLVATQQGYFLFVPRLISGVLGVGTIIIVYKITRLLFSKRTSLIAALLFALSFNHIQMSHSGRPWVSAIFFFALSIYFSLKLLTKKAVNPRNTVLSSVSAIVSFGFHQVGIVSIWFFLLVQVFRYQGALNNIFKDKITRLGLAVSILGIGLLIFLNRVGPTTGWFRNSTDLPANYPFISTITDILVRNNLLYHVTEIFLLEPIISIFFILSLRNKLSWKYPRHIVSIFCITTFFGLGFSFAQPRYMLPVILVMCVGAARAIDFFLKKIKKYTFKFIFLLTIFMVALAQPLFWNDIYMHEPTFIQVQKWINSHVPPQDVILTTATKFNGFTPSREVLDIQQRLEPEFYTSAEALLTKGEYPPNVRNIIYLNKVEFINDRSRVPKLLENFPVPFKYIIDIYWDPAETTLIQVDKSQFEKVASFTPLRPGQPKVKIDNLLATVYQPGYPKILQLVERAGPYIDIYKVK